MSLSTDDIMKELKKAGDNIKAVHEQVQSDFEQLQKTNKEIAEQTAKGVVDPILKELQDTVINSITIKHAALEERLNKAEAAMKRSELEGNAWDKKDQTHQFAKQFFTNVAVKHGRLEANKTISSDEVNVEAYNAYKSAFITHMRTAGDERNLSTEIIKALSVGSDPDGGYTVYPELSNRIIERQFEMSPTRQVCNVETINGTQLDILEDPEEFTVSRVSETGTSANSATAKLGKRSIVAHELEARPKATQSLLDDSGMDIEAWIVRKVAGKMGRVEANEHIVGDGVGGARGMTTYTSGTTWGTTIEQVASGASAGVTYAGITNWIYTLREMYHANASVMMHRTLVGKILALTGNDTPLWIPSIAQGQPSTLLGYPVRMASDFATPAANSLSAAFGDFREAYTIVDRFGMRVQRDPYTVKPYVEIYCVKRSGGDVTNTDAIKILKLAA